ncbi:MAG: ABC transporter permease, partial [Thermoanaerobaculia bacterium]
MYGRLLLESLRRGTRRKLLAVSAVALGTLGASALAEVMLASGDRLAAEMGSYGANLEVVPARDGETLPVADLAAVRKIFWRNNIVAIAPLHSLRVRWQPGAPGEAVAPLVGTWFDHALEPDWRTGLPRTRPTLKVEGRWPRETAGGEPAEVVLGRRLAARLSRHAGDEVQASLGEHSEALRVVGVLTSGGDEDEQAFAPLAAVQRLGGQPDRFTRAEIFALTTPEKKNTRPDPRRMSAEEYEAWYCTAYPSSIAFQLNDALPGARTSVVSGVTAATADVLGRLRGVLGALAAVALLGA